MRDDLFDTDISYKPGTPENERAARRRIGRELAWVRSRRESLLEIENAFLDRIGAEGCSALSSSEEERLEEVQGELEELAHAERQLTTETGLPRHRFPARYKPRTDTRHRRQAQSLHKSLAGLGIKDHEAFAASVLGFSTGHLSALTRAERWAVYEAAQAGRGAEDYAGPPSWVDRFCARLEALGASPAHLWCERIVGRKLTHLSAMTSKERGDVLRQVRHLNRRGLVGGRQPGEAVTGIRARGVRAESPEKKFVYPNQQRAG